MEFDVQERTEGESKWSTWSLIKYAVRNIVGFSSAPLQMITVAGVLTLLLAVVLGIQSLVKYFCGHALEGFTTVILLLLIIGSLIMLSLGVIEFILRRFTRKSREDRGILSPERSAAGKKTIKKDVSLSSFG